MAGLTFSQACSPTTNAAVGSAASSISIAGLIDLAMETKSGPKESAVEPFDIKRIRGYRRDKRLVDNSRVILLSKLPADLSSNTKPITWRLMRSEREL